VNRSLFIPSASVSVLSFAVLFLTAPMHANPYIRAIDDSMAVILKDRSIFLEFLTTAQANSPGSIELFLQKPGSLKSFYSSNGYHFPKAVYRIPFDQLSDSGRQTALKNLFPKDDSTASGWEHRVSFAGPGGETLWRIAEWFTGSGENASALSKANGITGDTIKVGQKILIPNDFLSSFLKQKQLVEPIVEGDLAFKEDAKGAYAQYILRKGETIYSNVVIRFTPRITSDEVLEAADIILKRTGLKSFHDIPANKILKIPVELLSPQYRPPNDPARIQYEQTAKESAQFHKTVQIKQLEGVTVVLDSGHGGIDPGAIGPYGELEDEYAYDVLCRVKELLESTTKARVIPTIRDFETQYKFRNTQSLSGLSNLEKILTTPPYLIQDAGTALSLRWMLANHHFSQAIRNAPSGDEQVVFTSFHADSLHPNASGIMIYLPGADYYKGSISKSASAFSMYKECKDQTKVSMSRKEKLRAEGFSASFAQQIIRSARALSVVVHSDQPIRKYIVRSRKVFVPSVLQFTRIPTRILIELANLKNGADRKRLQDPDYRQSLARAYVDALIRHFSGK